MIRLKIFVLITALLSGFSVFGADNVKMPPPYTWEKIKYTTQIPGNTYLQVMIVSTRDIEHSNGTFEINHGLHRETERTFFLACFFEDSVALIQQPTLRKGLEQMPKTKNFLMYVNGHGKNLRNMISRGYELSKNYEVNLILFDWPTNNIFLGATASNAWMSAPNFARTMLELSDIKGDLMTERAVSIVFHSMGALILKAFTGNPALDWIEEPFIDNIIVSAGAVRARNHYKWISKLDIQQNLYVTYNENDRTLKGAALLMMHKMLGHNPDEKRAQNSAYIDFTELAGNEHNYFLNRNELHTRNPEIETFFHHAFNGHDVFLEQDIHNNAAASLKP